MSDIQIEQADLSRPDHAEIFVSLLSAYIHDPKGQMSSNAHCVDLSVASNLRQCSNAVVFLARKDGFYAGMSVCFWGFSTFRNRPLLNVHDLVVLPSHRRNGIAWALLRHIESFAREKNACKLTLEVREDNDTASLLYSKFGFAEEPVPMRFKTKYLR